jgi:glycosyltransferase involved in cell wall biosynthesis
MKILHVVATLDLAAGGPPRIAVRLAAGAAALGHEVTILSYEVAGEAARAAIAADRAAVPAADQIRFDLLPVPNRMERLLARSARRRLKQIIADFEVVHTHDIWASISIAAVAVARRKSVPLVVLPNGMLDYWSLQQKWWKKRLVLAAGYRKRLNGAAFFHAGNVDEVDGIRAAGITAPVEIIPNGIYPQEFEPLPAAGRFYAAHPELDGKPFILFLSRLHYKKGLDYLAAAFAQIAGRHPDVRLVVAGPDDGAAEAFGAAIKTAGLESRVHVVGPVYSAARFDALVDAACFCLPSRQEGFSIAILEALACATPVVISKACHFPEVAAAGAGEAVDLTAEAVAAGLDRVLSDPEAKQRMGAAGRRMVLEQYAWPAISKRVVDAYQTRISAVRSS